MDGRRQKRVRQDAEDDVAETPTRLIRLLEQQERRIEQLERLLPQPRTSPEVMSFTVLPRDGDGVPRTSTTPMSLVATGGQVPRFANAAPTVWPLRHEDTSQRLDDVFRQIEGGLKGRALKGEEDDDDFLIRYFAYGWHAAASMHHVDMAWHFLHSIDQHLYRSMETVARLAALRCLRNMFVHKIKPVNQPVRKIPSFLAPTRLQQERQHCSLTDYFAWPAVRDYFIRHEDILRAAPQSAHNAFASDFTFDWPYEFRDIYTVEKATGRLRFSKEFDCCFNQLQCWKLSSISDASLIPAHLCPTLHIYPAALNFNLSYETEIISELNLASHPEVQSPSAQSTAVVTFQNYELLGLLNTAPEPATWLEELFGDNPSATEEAPVNPSSEGHRPVQEWAWAFDTERPEYTSMQQLLHMAMPM